MQMPMYLCQIIPWMDCCFSCLKREFEIEGYGFDKRILSTWTTAQPRSKNLDQTKESLYNIIKEAMEVPK